MRSFFFHPRQERLVANTERQRQARVQTPLILEERGMRIGGDVRIADTEVQVEVVVGAQQEVRRRIAGPRTGEGEARRADEDLLELQLQHFVAELEVVLAADPAHGVLELVVLALESCGEAGSECEVVGDIDRY